MLSQLVKLGCLNKEFHIVEMLRLCKFPACIAAWINYAVTVIGLLFCCFLASFKLFVVVLSLLLVICCTVMYIRCLPPFLRFVCLGLRCALFSYVFSTIYFLQCRFFECRGETRMCLHKLVHTLARDNADFQLLATTSWKSINCCPWDTRLLKGRKARWQVRAEKYSDQIKEKTDFLCNN